MPKPESRLHLLLPGLLGPMPLGEDEAGFPRLGKLELLLARARRESTPGRDLESTLFARFGLAPDESLPSAPFRRLGYGGEPDQRYWLQADTIYLRPDQDRLLLFDTRDQRITMEEAEQLGSLIRDHFQDEDWHLEQPEPHRWFLALEEEPELATQGIPDLFGRNMDLFLPKGADAMKWHGILNEIQMLFFASEVNHRRESQGAVPVSGLWFSGGGSLQPLEAGSLARVSADDPLVTGLARMAEISHGPFIEEAEQLLTQSGEQMLVYDRLQRPVWHVDLQEWLLQLETLQEWLEPLLDGVREGSVGEIIIYPCNGVCYRYNRSTLRRFWRRPKPLTAQLDANPELRQVSL